MKSFSCKLVLFAALASIATCRGSAQDNPGAAFAVSDGKGTIQVLWFPPATQWPAGGWRISDSSANVAVPHVAMGDASALAPLSVEDADTIRHLPAVLNKPTSNDKKQRNLINLLGLRAFSDPAYARALGLFATIPNALAGSRVYTIQGLDEAGKATGVKLATADVDSSQPTPLPAIPDGVQAKVDDKGVSLSWNPPPENRALPVVACAVERGGNSISVKPFVVGTRWNPSIALVVDRNAPPNATADYKVYSVDAFGRRSQPASIRIFFPDFAALTPPTVVKANASPGKVVVNWTAESRPNRSGYVVERAFMANGPWETLMTQVLPNSTSQYEDEAVRGGTTYYYRVRAVDPRGDIGPPSQAASAAPANNAAPPQVSGLAADTGQTRVRLTWSAVPFPVAGYFVERRAIVASAPAANWVRLNSHVSPEPLYDDYIGLSSSTTFEYRALAVALDNAEGPPSNVVQVTLADLTVPGQPTISSISGEGGKVALTFVPAVPEERTTQYLVLRSGNAKDIGVVLGDPLPATARQYQDLYVSPGETYFYRLVAVDAAGNRSDATQPFTVRVGLPTLPKAASPVLKRVSTPSPHVTLQFDSAPAGLSAVIERQDSPTAGWIRVAGPLNGNSVDDFPPGGNSSVSYRVAYVSSSGGTGEPSPAVSLANAQQ
jgi:hypothetical protein